MYLPFNYEKINIHSGTYTPSPVKNKRNRSFDYWVRSLFHRAMTVIDFELEDSWDGQRKDFWYFCLFKYGFVSIQDLERYGYTFSPVGLTGYDFYYQPTIAILSNPTLTDSKELEIGKDCQIVKLTPDYMGIWDIIEYYAEKLALLDNAINMSLVNNKFAFLLGAKNKAAAQALKKMLDKINQGEPAVIYDMRIMDDNVSKETPFQLWSRDHLKDSYLTTQQLQDLQTIINNFDSEVGIPGSPYQKKERETQFESQSKIADGSARVSTWMRCLETSIKAVKELYPDIKLSASLHYNYEDIGPLSNGLSQEGGDDNGIS